MKNESGFTLVEIMVALTLSLLLMLGISNIFVGNRETYRVQSGLSTLQENARFAMDAIRRDLAMAGYPNDFRNADAIQPPFDAAQTIESGNDTPDQVAVINYLSDTDCDGAVFVPPTSYTRWYHIVRDPVTQAPALYCNNTLVVDGVENLQMQYGIDTDDDQFANSYVTANNVPDWNYVRSVRFALLINSVDPVSRTPDNATYRLLDAPSAPFATDQLRRRVFFGTVVLRNNSQAF